MLKYCSTFLFIIAFGNSFAQDFNYAVLNRKNIIHLNNDMGYSRLINQNLILTSNIEVTFIKPSGKGIQLLKQGSLSIGGHYLLINKNKWKTVTALNLTNRYDDVPGYKRLFYLTNWRIIGGYYTTTWFLAGEIGMFVPVISKLNFDRVHYVSPIANDYNDGWQRVGGIGFNYGVQVGYTIKKRADIIVRYGINTKQKSFGREIKNATYFDITVNYRFGKVINNTAKEE